MPIVLRGDAPRDGAQAITSALNDLATFPAADSALGGAAIDLSQPIAVYRLGLEDIAPDASTLATATLISWRYLMESGGNGEIAYADVTQQQNVSKLASLSKNENAAALLRAAQVAQDAAAALPHNVEIRTLEVPAVKLAAVWLSNSTHLFVPYIDGETAANIKQSVMDLNQFLAEINRRAAYVR